MFVLHTHDTLLKVGARNCRLVPTWAPGTRKCLSVTRISRKPFTVCRVHASTWAAVGSSSRGPSSAAGSVPTVPGQANVHNTTGSEGSSSSSSRRNGNSNSSIHSTSNNKSSSQNIRSSKPPQQVHVHTANNGFRHSSPRSQQPHINHSSKGVSTSSSEPHAVVVIGGGAAGLTAAFFAAQQGAEVCCAVEHLCVLHDTVVCTRTHI